MFRLSITPKKCKPFFLEFETEDDFYEAIYTLEKSFSGVADFTLYHNDKPFIVGCIGKAPQRVFNTLNRTWYSFSEFLTKPFDFPLTTRLLYRKYLNMDISRLYGLY